MDEWVDHDQRGKPDLSDDTPVEVMFRDGGKDRSRTVGYWHGKGQHSNWDASDGTKSPSVIIAYRVLFPPNL